MGGQLDRRGLIKTAGAAALLATAGSSARAAVADQPKGRIRQSICQWCYPKMTVQELAREAKAMGYQALDLLTPEQFLLVKDSGLTCAMLAGVQGIGDCLNRRDQHDRVEKQFRTNIAFAAAHGLKNVICFSGNRKGLSDEEGIKVCAEGLKRVLKLAEESNVTLVMELLNSKVDHKDYQCDHTEWGVKLCKELGSPNFKLLYDIYHMQIMEGDVIRTIKKHHQWIADSQEIFYPAVMKAIVETGFTGFVAQEFIPQREPLASLAQAFKICDV
jgi:hydroxypyruvate isomerase